MKKFIVYGIFFIVYSLISFFGLGPVLLADGPISERILTFIIVLIAYFITSYAYVKYSKKQNNK